MQDQDSVRKSFDRLVRGVFGISFEAWHRAGYCTDRIPPSIRWALFEDSALRFPELSHA